MKAGRLVRHADFRDATQRLSVQLAGAATLFGADKRRPSSELVTSLQYHPLAWRAPRCER